MCGPGVLLSVLGFGFVLGAFGVCPSLRISFKMLYISPPHKTPLAGGLFFVRLQENSPHARREHLTEKGALSARAGFCG